VDRQRGTGTNSPRQRRERDHELGASLFGIEVLAVAMLPHDVSAGRDRRRGQPLGL